MESSLTLCHTRQSRHACSYRASSLTLHSPTAQASPKPVVMSLVNMTDSTEHEQPSPLSKAPSPPFTRPTLHISPCFTSSRCPRLSGPMTSTAPPNPIPTRISTKHHPFNIKQHAHPTKHQPVPFQARPVTACSNSQVPRKRLFGRPKAPSRILDESKEPDNLPRSKRAKMS